MQKPINYIEFFTFTLYQPIAILEGGSSLEEVEKDLMENGIFPISYIKDKNNPVFQKTREHFKKSGITQEIILIILPLVYTKENNT